jgi:hypothetical protein
VTQRVVETLEKSTEQGIAASGQGVEESGPFLAEKLVGELLGLGDIPQGQEDVVALLKGDALLTEGSGQPFVAVEVDLCRERKPGGQPHMHEAKGGIEEVEVQDETTAPVTLQAWPTLAIADAEGRAGFLT